MRQTIQTLTLPVAIKASPYLSYNQVLIDQVNNSNFSRSKFFAENNNILPNLIPKIPIHLSQLP